MAWPSSKKINVNSVFILFGKKIPSGKLYLKGGDARIELGILVWCNGTNGVSQVLFSPKEKLKSNTLYTLVNDSGRVISGIKGEEKVEPFSWKTTSTIDELAPFMEEFPTLIKTENVTKRDLTFRFSFRAGEPSDMFLVVVCKEAETNSVQVQLVPAQKNSFELAGNNCLGGFNFEPGKKYSVSFQLTDESGNVADLGGRPVTIHIPEN